MPSYRTPGVYVEEIQIFPPSVAPVATAIPAFIGYTEKAIGRQGEDLTNTPTRISSLLEYEALFGKSPQHTLKVKVTAADSASETRVEWDGGPPTEPKFLLHYAMQLYFANGGGPCHVHSIGEIPRSPESPESPAAKHFTDAITALETKDEPTLLVFPDAVHLDDAGYAAVVNAGLESCRKMQDRFVIADVPKAVSKGTDDNEKVTTSFRNKVTGSVDVLKYGAAYFPYLNTSLPFACDDDHVRVTTSDNTTPESGGATAGEDGSTAGNDGTTAGEDGTTAGGDGGTAGGSGTKTGEGEPLSSLKDTRTAVYAAIRAFIDQAYVTMPPSAAIAGVYAQVDRTRGVWKAPANVGLNRVIGPAVNITNDLQDDLNIDPTSGKSVNAIRAFFGKGTLVWGARTLAGNDNEWRYVNVRRFANFVEESVRKAIGTFVFEPNDANTWVKVRSMIENFLINQWRDGALMGAKPDQAFEVAVGLGKTMSADDVLNGYMIVEVYLSIVRPAEFIVLRFMQKMPEA